MRFEVAPLPLDVVVCFFLWTGIVPSLWEFVWNTSRNGICLYYYLVYPSLGRLYFTHNSGWHLICTFQDSQISSQCTLGRCSLSCAYAQDSIWRSFSRHCIACSKRFLVFSGLRWSTERLSSLISVPSVRVIVPPPDAYKRKLNRQYLAKRFSQICRYGS